MTETNGMTIVEFLEARIAEDEADAINRVVLPSTDRRSLTDYDAERAHAECAAKRALLEEHGLMEVASLDRASWGQPFTVCRVCAIGARQIVAPCPSIKALAAVYKDHPGYQQEWEA